LENPAAVTVTVYLPGASASMRYTPSALEVAERVTPFASSVAITVAFVTAFPDGSFTVTCISPVAAPCAIAFAAMATINIAIASVLLMSFIYFSW
jgi:hypothetical protein